MFDWFTHKTVRRTEIRKNRPDANQSLVQRMQAQGAFVALGIVAAFCVSATAILLLRDSVVAYRPGQWAPHDIVSRVDFAFRDDRKLAEIRRVTRESTPRVYKPAALD